MKRQLKTVVNKLVNKHKKELRYYLLEILYKTKNEKLWLIEGEVIEITYNSITVSFTWDMISAVNNKTNEFIDLISIPNEDYVIEFFESNGILMPICNLWKGGSCPYCIEDEDYFTKEAKLINKQCCETHRNLTEKEFCGG